MSALSETLEWFQLLAFIVVPAAAAVAAHALFRRFVPPEWLRRQHDVAGFLVAVVGVLYSVVLGFLVVTVWTSFDTAQQTADLEAAYVGDAVGFAQTLPEPVRSQVQGMVAAYAIEVRDREWPSLARGNPDPRARALLLGAIGAMLAAPIRNQPSLAATLRSEYLTESTLTSLRQIVDTRRLRLIQAKARLPRTMYGVLFLGALMIVVFVFFFGVESAALQLTMTALIAGSIGLQFGLIEQLSTAYSGAIRVSPEAWSYVIDSNDFATRAKGYLP